jgi:hypothetical protein
MVFFYSCNIPYIEDYSEFRMRELREYEKSQKYSVDLNTILDEFVLFKPETEAVVCANEYEMIIEKIKNIQLSQPMLENLLILCQRMIWEKKRAKVDKKSKGDKKSNP